MFAAIASPSSTVASCEAETKRAPSSPQAATTAASMRSLDRSRSLLRAKSAVGATSRFMTEKERPLRDRGRFSKLVATTRSQPSTRSAAPTPMREAKITPGSRAIRTWLETAPFFCARPVTSSSEQPLPSRWAATARIAPTVTTPVPPIPAISTFHGSVHAATAGWRKPAKSASAAATPSPVAFFTLPPSTDTKLGQ